MYRTRLMVAREIRYHRAMLAYAKGNLVNLKNDDEGWMWTKGYISGHESALNSLRYVAKLLPKVTL